MNPLRNQTVELSPENSGDNSLIELCLADNQEAQYSLFEKHKFFVLGICLRYTSSKDDAEDYLQEAFIRIFTSLKRKPPMHSLKGWIATITIRTVIDQIRKKYKFKTEEISIEPANENLAIEQLTNMEIIQLLQSMPTGYRTIFNLYIVEGYDHTEIAKMLDITESTSRSQLARAKDWIKDKIKTYNLWN